MWYVTMTDRCLSGWGDARGRISKYVIACESWALALHVHGRALGRKEMRYVNYRYGKQPYYTPKKYHTSIVNASEATWFTKGFRGEIKP